uniref:hypothetical protein n=1 Tax=Klebsiella aerogenes TaxID=548 RepID=UPI00195404EF
VMVIVRLAALTGLAFLAALVDAHALTDLECSKKFQEAVNAGTTHGLTWTQFKKSEYGPGAKPVAEPIEALKDELKKDGSSEEN